MSNRSFRILWLAGILTLSLGLTGCTPAGPNRWPPINGQPVAVTGHTEEARQ